MTDIKSFLASKTIWGVFLTVVAIVLNLMGYSLTESDQSVLMNAVANILDVFGPILAVYGRVVASKKIG